MRNPRERRLFGRARILCVIFGAGLMAIGPGAGASTQGSELWVSRYNGPANAYDQTISLATSPDGARVFVTGRSWGVTSNFDYATIAYDPAGNELWVSRYNGPGNGPDEPHTLTVSPDGNVVFVTGVS